MTRKCDFRSISDIIHPKTITPTGNFVQDVNLKTCARAGAIRWASASQKDDLVGGALAVGFGLFFCIAGRILLISA
jgi:hypothetical protein